MPALVRSSPAKLNLFLHITGKRDDGYHLIESLFIKLNLHDQIKINLDKHLQCHTYRNGQSIEIPDNLALRAAKLLQERHNVASGALIEIDKRIPMQSGLGGASSNAATVLMMLNQLWELNLTTGQLKEYGQELGADTSFFLQSSQLAFICGIGEDITPIQGSIGMKIPCLIIHPGVGISTQAVYDKSVDSFDVSMLNNLKLHLEKKILDFIPELVYNSKNSLYETALLLHPALADVTCEVGMMPGCKLVRMSGSGSAIFAFFENSEQMYGAEHSLGIQYGKEGWTVHGEILSM